MTNCATRPDGIQCFEKSEWANCKPWDLTEQSKTHCFIDNLSEESLNIAGAKLNVHRLKGIHEQTRLLDLTGNGNPISGGSLKAFPADNAFTNLSTQWVSGQRGVQATLSQTYIGYDFGAIKIGNGRDRYAKTADVCEHISTIKIKQSNDENCRVTKARVERSTDCINWYGVSIITLPNDSELNTINFKHSIISRYWRIRPLTFLGNDSDRWGVQALEMHDYTVTALDNIEDKLFLENRNREYDTKAVLLKGYYQILSAPTELLKYGIEISSANYVFSINFNNCVKLIGRPLIIGDIIELPSEVQFSPDLTPRKLFLEVNDVTWDASTYTPGWMPTNLSIGAIPALASEETQDIFGDLASSTDDSGLFNNHDEKDESRGNWQDYSEATQFAAAEALKNAPMRGSEGSNTVREFSKEEIAQGELDGVKEAMEKMNFRRKGMYVEDAIPQNGDPYTEGTEFPVSPKDKDYHRMTFAGLADDVPARLYRYSVAKSQWVFLETDLRHLYDGTLPRLSEYIADSSAIPVEKIK